MSTDTCIRTIGPSVTLAKSTEGQHQHCNRQQVELIATGALAALKTTMGWARLIAMTQTCWTAFEIVTVIGG